MSKRRFIALSLAASFALVVLALVTTKLTSRDAAPPESAAESPAEVDALRAREQELIRRIERANRRLEEQERTLDEARRRLAAPPSTAPARWHDDDDDDDDDHDDESYASRWDHDDDD